MIELFVIFGLVLDILFTYKFLIIYKERFPKKDYTAVETNPLIRSLVRQLGIFDGIMISGGIIFCILVLLLSIIPYHWKYFLLGVYYMMVTFHLTNFLAIRRIKKVKQ